MPGIVALSWLEDGANVMALAIGPMRLIFHQFSSLTLGAGEE